LKNQQALTLLFTANAISGFAQGVSMLAIPWYFAKQDLSSSFNLIFASVTFVNIFWGLFAGTLVDRFNRKRLFLTTNAVEGTILILVAAYGWMNGGLGLTPIVMVFAITVFGYRMHYPNLYAFVQEISSPEHYTRVTSYIEIVGQATNVLAGALAVILLEGIDLMLPWGWHLQIEAWSIYEIFTLDAFTYLISVAIIYFIRYVPDKVFEIDKGRLRDRLRIGFSFLREHPRVFIFGFFTHSIFVVMLVSLFTVMPMYITNYLQVGGEVFGGMEVVYGLGALTAGVFMGNWARNRSKAKVIIVLMFVTTVVLALCAVIRFVPYYFLTGLIIGFTNAGTRILRVSYLFDHVPNKVIGRVNSVFSVMNIIMRVVFTLIFSLTFFAQETNITFAYLIMGAFTLVSGWILYYNFGRKSVAT